MDKQILTNKEHITNYVVEHFQNLFKNASILEDFSLVENMIPILVNEKPSTLLTMLPTMDETHSAMFNLKNELEEWNFLGPYKIEPYFLDILTYHQGGCLPSNPIILQR